MSWISESRRWAVCGAAAIVIFGLPVRSVHADALVEPPIFSSSGGLLDILMIAEPMLVPTISFTPPSGGQPINPIGWVYTICSRRLLANECKRSDAVSSYGGVRLALQPGDVFKIRLVNRLPRLDRAKVKHGTEPGQSNLFRNPTNLHTHGLIVSPRQPTKTDPTFGDFIFVQVYNSANGIPKGKSPHSHGSAMLDYVDYRIEIPKNHPAGLFWFHPHVHGISLNQVSSGLAGIISIGNVADYIKDPPEVIRHLILKDIQVLAAGTLSYESGHVTVADGEVQNQQIADFCEQFDKGGPNSREGFCEGQPDEHGDGNSFIGSRWYFTINGQVFPTIRINSSAGEIWRLTNASAQVSYRLSLLNDSNQMPIAMQLVSIDGVSIAIPPGTPANTVVAISGSKFTLKDCPSSTASSPLVCVQDLVLMPSARAEVWVTYRNDNGLVVPPPAGATATLKQGIINLGPGAEAWPEVKLAKIEFAQPEPKNTAVKILGTPTIDLSSTENLGATAAHAEKAHAGAACRSLAQGHRRRVFFGLENPSDPKSRFGLGYEEVDQYGQVVPGTTVKVEAFNPQRPLVCLPLGSGRGSVHETWELVNLSNETHNFHLHQTKFRVLDAATTGTSQNSSPTTDTAVIWEDNIPVPFGIVDSKIAEKQNGYCTIAQWRAGQCKPQPVVIDILFSEAGEYVFHCHILEHEDGGMMAKIKVTTDGQTQ